MHHSRDAVAAARHSDIREIIELELAQTKITQEPAAVNREKGLKRRARNDQAIVH
jgi:hypothetical protein